MKKLIVTSLSLALFIPSTFTFADSINEPPIPDRPSNATPGLGPVKAGPTDNELEVKYGVNRQQLKKAIKASKSPNKIISNPITTKSLKRVELYEEPDTINISIYTLDSRKAEGEYQKTVTVDFDDYVEDVLPNEWKESWGNSSKGKHALRAGALAVKTFGWFHVIDWKKDSKHNANVTNGTKSQVYIKGSNKPNCNEAIDYVSSKVIGVEDDYEGTLYETGYKANASDDGYQLSQEGSYEDAMDGDSYDEIIAHWYRDNDLVVRQYWEYVNLD